MFASAMRRAAFVVSASLVLSTPALAAPGERAGSSVRTVAVPPVVHYRTAKIGGVDIFYREAGPADGPVVLLLHGFPTSSHMFRNLIPLLADRYRVIAPDYPGFGESGMPDRKSFRYSFAHYAELMNGLMQQLGARRYGMSAMDYGAPVGYRMALMNPERVSALIVQNGNAYTEGLAGFWDPIKAYWAQPNDQNRQAIAHIMDRETTAFQYTDGVRDVSRVDPDNVGHDQPLLDRPGNRDIQLDLFLDYGTNVPLYPQFQAYFRKYRPPTIIVWGKNDKIFPAEGAAPYLRDLPDAEYHILDTGHFVLEDQLDVAAPLIRDFLDRKVTKP